MIHQLRIYEIFDNNRQAFLDRFRDEAWRIMKGYGFEVLAFWEEKGGEKPRFVYLLQWPDEETMRSSWTAFMADEEWKEIKRVTGAEHGVMVGDIDEKTLIPTGFSPTLMAR